MAVTLKDIAKLTGVSYNTVWRAVNNKPGINKKTKEVILKIAEELNYTPNVLARSLRGKKTNTLGVLIPHTKDLFFGELVNGIETAAKKEKYSIFLCNFHNEPEMEYDSIKILLEKRIDGILIHPSQKNYRYIKLLNASKVPFVFLNLYPDSTEFNYITSDYRYGSYIAVNYLIKKGYKEIYFIGTPIYYSSYISRVEGCERAFKKNNKSLNEFSIIHIDDDVDSCYNVIKRDINYKGSKLGLFVSNDRMALVVFKAIIDKGLKIPEEVGIIGYDDVEYSKHLSIPLTTVQNPASEIGTKGAEIIIKKIESKDFSGIKQIVLKPKLIIRETAWIILKNYKLIKNNFNIN